MKIYGRETEIKTYAQAREFLGDRIKRKLLNNTYLEMREAGRIALRYYQTDVITYEPDGRVILNTGGWKTITTKERLNAFSPVGVYVKRGIWYVSHYEGNGVHTDLGLYRDGMTIDPATFKASAA